MVGSKETNISGQGISNGIGVCLQANDVANGHIPNKITYSVDYCALGQI
jgi:hypothetical protein